MWAWPGLAYIGPEARASGPQAQALTTLVVLSQTWITAMYFERFAGVRVTILFSMSHTKPMNTGAEEKGVSLEGSQGIPKRSDI